MGSGRVQQGVRDEGYGFRSFGACSLAFRIFQGNGFGSRAVGIAPLLWLWGVMVVEGWKASGLQGKYGLLSLGLEVGRPNAAGDEFRV